MAYRPVACCLPASLGCCHVSRLVLGLTSLVLYCLMAGCIAAASSCAAASLLPCLPRRSGLAPPRSRLVSHRARPRSLLPCPLSAPWLPPARLTARRRVYAAQPLPVILASTLALCCAAHLPHVYSVQSRCEPLPGCHCREAGPMRVISLGRQRCRPHCDGGCSVPARRLPSSEGAGTAGRSRRRQERGYPC